MVPPLASDFPDGFPRVMPWPPEECCLSLSYYCCKQPKLSSLDPIRVVPLPYPCNRGRIYCFKKKMHMTLLQALLPIYVRDEPIYVQG